MKAKFFIAGLLLAGAVISVSAQSYKDGIEYYKVDQLDNAKEWRKVCLDYFGTFVK